MLNMPQIAPEAFLPTQSRKQPPALLFSIPWGWQLCLREDDENTLVTCYHFLTF